MTATHLLGNATYIAGVFDVAELAFILFFIFFVGLVIYLNRESRREGYPLEDEQTGLVMRGQPLTDGAKKTFHLPHGRGTYVPENVARDSIDIPAKQAFAGRGAPFVPTGDPMKDGLGPAAYANRQNYPDLTMDGAPRIVPIANSVHGHVIAAQDRDPVGLPVYGADKKKAGVISDVWVDQSESIIRYVEVTTNSGRKVLAPMGFVAIQGKSFMGGILPFDDQVELADIEALRSDQFDAVPDIATPGQITRLEEDKIQAYYGGGYLYATPERAEPWL